MSELSDVIETMSSAITQILENSAKHYQEICYLQVKCASLENILLHIVIKSISENDQATYTTIANIASNALSLVPEEHKSSDFAEKLKNILSIRERMMPKPFLQLVKPLKADSQPAV